MRPKLGVIIVMMVWVMVALVILILAAFSDQGDVKGLAIWMLIVGLPGSILVNLFFDAVNFGRFLPDSELALLYIWLPYFVVGLVQWYAISTAITALYTAIARQCTANKSIKRGAPKC